MVVINKVKKYFGKVTFNPSTAEKLEKLADNLTIHGLPTALRSKTWAGRIFWMALFLLAVGWLIYMLITIYDNIKAQPNVINLQHVKRTAMEFPEITICPEDSFNNQKLIQSGISLDITNFMILSLDTQNMTELIDLLNATATDILESRRKEIYRVAKNWREFLRNFSVSCESFFLTCYVDSNEFNCCNVFRPFYTKDRGVCFRSFNRTGMLLQHNPGVNGSLQVLLKSDKTIDYWTGGFRWKGITIGMPTLQTPYITPTGRFLLIQLRVDCSHKMWDLAVKEICNCAVQSYSTDNETICDPFSYLICERDHFRELRQMHSIFTRRNCSMQLCEEWTFQVGLSYSEINRAWVHSITGEADYMSDYTFVNFYFPELRYPVVTEFAQLTFENIISQVGGLMGLWIGCSMISIVQLIAYGFQYLIGWLLDWIRKGKDAGEIARED